MKKAIIRVTSLENIVKVEFELFKPWLRLRKSLWLRSHS